MRFILLFLVSCVLAADLPAQAASPLEAERARNEEEALRLWPEIADGESIMAREVDRLLDYYEIRGDPRLKQVTAPMWIASQAAANIERMRNEREAQQSAMRLYPELGVLDSPLNKLFRETHDRYRAVEPAYFSDPRWPIKLAQQSALQLEAQRAASNLRGAKAVGGVALPSGANPSEHLTAEQTSASTPGWVVPTALSLIGAGLLFAMVRIIRRHPPVDHGEEQGSSI
jgi:hypothetical protein